ncbi:MAG: cobyrinate a,c-diamide synthase [Deltaproteobacteria bacterium]|nr:cobyrinate a,c-diamide synthase [Deltaproteobacteria bacterium]MBF0526798.1 cobyrinate a,c-diamide synthase [Deltaproteobacteria bacterium]
MSCPRILIAGTNSGVGKTSVTLALVGALRQRGLRVQTFKVGPDYLDPTYLARASGRPCYNLDGWMMGRDYVRDLFARQAALADISVIEGVMGLFDGSDPVSIEGSTAQIAAWLHAPVVLVVNVHGLARSIAPLVKGFAEFDPEVTIRGVIANKCGTERHQVHLARSLAACDLPPLTAAIPRDAFPALPSRHLGLVTADHRNLSDEIIQRLGRVLDTPGTIETMIKLADQAPDMEALAVSPGINPRPDPVRLGLADDAAFHFYYQDNLDALEAAGCDLIRFSPLHDASLPEGLAGLYLGGGYPEEYAAKLAANQTMIQAVRDFARSGRPIYAECGGLMYLSQGITLRDGRRPALTGLLPQGTRMLDRLKALGYVEVTLTRDSLLGRAGDRLRGHEFHYSELDDPAAEVAGWEQIYVTRKPGSDTTGREGRQQGRVLVSYVHLHLASRPEAVRHFVAELAASA